MSGLDWSSIENIQSTNRIFMDFDTGTTSEIGPPASRHVYHAYIRDVGFFFIALVIFFFATHLNEKGSCENSHRI